MQSLKNCLQSFPWCLKRAKPTKKEQEQATMQQLFAGNRNFSITEQRNYIKIEDQSSKQKQIMQKYESLDPIPEETNDQKLQNSSILEVLNQKRPTEHNIKLSNNLDQNQIQALSFRQQIYMHHKNSYLSNSSMILHLTLLATYILFDDRAEIPQNRGLTLFTSNTSIALLIGALNIYSINTNNQAREFRASWDINNILFTNNNNVSLTLSQAIKIEVLKIALFIISSMLALFMPSQLAIFGSKDGNSVVSNLFKIDKKDAMACDYAVTMGIVFLWTTVLIKSLILKCCKPEEVDKLHIKLTLKSVLYILLPIIITTLTFVMNKEIMPYPRPSKFNPNEQAGDNFFFVQSCFSTPNQNFFSWQAIVIAIYSVVDQLISKILFTEDGKYKNSLNNKNISPQYICQLLNILFSSITYICIYLSNCYSIIAIFTGFVAGHISAKELVRALYRYSSTKQCQIFIDNAMTEQQRISQSNNISSQH